MRAVIYARYSSDNQREESIEDQLRDCNGYAKYDDIEIVGQYINREYRHSEIVLEDAVPAIIDKGLSRHNSSLLRQVRRIDDSLFRNKSERQSL